MLPMSEAYQAYVTALIARLKAGQTDDLGGPTLPVADGQRTVALISPLTRAALQEEAAVARLARWRQENQAGFPERFTVTTEGTRRWMEQAVFGAPDRVLFWLAAVTGEPVGHLGLFRFDYAGRSCEADNIVRGRRDMLPGVMTPALAALMAWTFRVLDVGAINLKVLSDNQRAIALYQRTGFTTVGEIPLFRRELTDGSVRWVEQADDPGQPPERTYTVMRCVRPTALGTVRFVERSASGR